MIRETSYTVVKHNSHLHRSTFFLLDINYIFRSRVKMPATLLSAYHGGVSLNRQSLLKLSFTDLVKIAQWSDMIVFDYITGHYDRLV